MYFDDLIQRSYIKSEPPNDEEVVLLMAGCQSQIDRNLVVAKSDFEEILMNNRAKDPTSEAILMSIGRSGITLGDPIWGTMLQRESVVDHYTMLYNKETANTLSSLEHSENAGQEPVYQENPAAPPDWGLGGDAGGPAPWPSEENSVGEEPEPWPGEEVTTEPEPWPASEGEEPQGFDPSQIGEGFGFTPEGMPEEPVQQEGFYGFGEGELPGETFPQDNPGDGATGEGGGDPNAFSGVGGFGFEATGLPEGEGASIDFGFGEPDPVTGQIPMPQTEGEEPVEPVTLPAQEGFAPESDIGFFAPSTGQEAGWGEESIPSQEEEEVQAGFLEGEEQQVFQEGEREVNIYGIPIGADCMGLYLADAEAHPIYDDVIIPGEAEAAEEAPPPMGLDVAPTTEEDFPPVYKEVPVDENDPRFSYGPLEDVEGGEFPQEGEEDGGPSWAAEPQEEFAGGGGAPEGELVVWPEAPSNASWPPEGEPPVGAEALTLGAEQEGSPVVGMVQEAISTFGGQGSKEEMSGAEEVIQTPNGAQVEHFEVLGDVPGQEEHSALPTESFEVHPLASATDSAMQGLVAPAVTEHFEVLGYTGPTSVEESAQERFEAPVSSGKPSMRPGFVEPGGGLGSLRQLPTEGTAEGIPLPGSCEEFATPCPVEDADINITEEHAMCTEPNQRDGFTLEQPGGEADALPTIAEGEGFEGLSPSMGMPPVDEEGGNIFPETFGEQPEQFGEAVHPVAGLNSQDYVGCTLGPEGPQESSSLEDEETAKMLETVRNAFNLFHSLSKQHSLAVILASENMSSMDFCEQILQDFPAFTEQFEESMQQFNQNYDRAAYALVQLLQLEAESAVHGGDSERANKCITPVCKLIYA